MAASVKDTYARFDTEAVLKIGDPQVVRRAALVAVDSWRFATEDAEQVKQATKDARAAIRESLVDALHAIVDPERLINAAGSVQLESSAINIGSAIGRVAHKPPHLISLISFRCADVGKPPARRAPVGS